jgi:exodeoxyribonuclease VIII
MSKIEPGIYEGMSFDDYCQIDAINNSSLKVMKEKSPKHYKYYVECGREETDAMRIGSALHTRILEPDAFDSRYIVIPDVDRRTKAGKEVYQEAESDGRTIVKQSEMEMMEAIVENLRQKNVASLLGGVKLETCIVWTDEDTGLLCKARMDFWRQAFNYIGDLKSTVDACPEHFSREVIRYLYHQQAAFYVDGMKTLTLSEPRFYLIPVEKSPPYDSAAYELDDDALRAGRLSYKASLKTIKSCQESGVWPGYCHKGVAPLYLPDWYLKQNGINEYNMEA